MSGAEERKTVADIMQRNLVTVEASMSLREAVEILRGQGVSGAPVLRGNRLVGVLSTTDILEFEATSPDAASEGAELPDWTEGSGRSDEDEIDNPAAFFFGRWEDASAVENLWERMRAPDGPEPDHLERHVVDEIMSRDVVAVSMGTPLAEAARRMIHHRIHRLLVVDGDDLVGVVSALDFVRVVAETR